MKRTFGIASTVLLAITLAYAGMARADKKIVLGFSQIGAESEWRTANTKSIKDSATKADITLKFSDAQQKQENQIKAIRSFIAQKVDVIAFSPVVETGWEPVLREAKAAKIPVILSDRSVDVKDDSLWVAFMGSDFVEEGRRAAKWLIAYAPVKDLAAKGDVNIVELQGTLGSAPAIDRKAGFEQVLKANPGIRWVQLPWAGVEPYANAGVLDREHQWTCGKGVYAQPVAEHALALALAGLHHLKPYSEARTWTEQAGLGLTGGRVCIFGGGGNPRPHRTPQ